MYKAISFFLKVFVTALLFIFVNGCSKSETSNTLVDAHEVTQNLDVVLKLLAEKQSIPVVFPRVLPRDAKHPMYYLNEEILVDHNRKGYVIYANYTKECRGEHVCNAGYLRAEKNIQPEVFYDNANNIITEDISLAQDIKGYYTPGHPMGSYFPPVIQWQEKNVLYTLSWDDKLVDKNNLIMMANSAIDQK